MNNLSIENAKLLFRNFAGKPTKFTPAGVRDFCVVVPNDVAEQLISDGWRVKKLTPKDEDEAPTYILNVKVSYAQRPPKVVMMTSKKKTALDEGSIACLDYAEIKQADVIISPYQWEVRGETGIKAYLKTLYVTIEEDDFASKYDDIPEDDDSPF